MPVTKDNLDQIFTYHPADTQQLEAYVAVRAAAKDLAAAILEHVPPCADQNAALRIVREAVMTANAGIALRGIV